VLQGNIWIAMCLIGRQVTSGFNQRIRRECGPCRWDLHSLAKRGRPNALRLASDEVSKCRATPAEFHGVCAGIPQNVHMIFSSSISIRDRYTFRYQ
jgi:hypothetical protein